MNDIENQTGVEKSAPGTGRTRWTRAALAIVLCALVVAVVGIGVGAYRIGASTEPCSRVADLPAIAPADLPDGLGRGFPMVCLAEGENGAAPLEAGAPAPNFTMLIDETAQANGGQLSLTSLHGRPVLINFWASWCGPCRLEMPDIVKASGEYDDLVVLAVNVQEEAAAYEAFANEFGMELPVVVDQDGDLRRLYGIRNMPTSIFIDRDGTVSTVWAGFLTADALREFIGQIR